MRVAFIGLGAIGYPMAQHVANSFDTILWNRTADKASRLADLTGATVAGTPEEAFRLADVVITCLPTSSEVREVVGQGGNAWKSGKLLIDCTSGDPVTSRELARELAARSCGFVDAPVSGGTTGAERGELTVMLGGADPWITTAEEVVRPFGKTVVRVGDVGAGHAVKAVNNALLAASIIAAGEGLAALTKFGVDPKAAIDVINASSGRSNVTENLIPERVLSGSWPRTFRLALLDKDVGIAVRLLDQMGTSAGVLAETKRAFSEARTRLEDEADHVEAIRLIEQDAGVTIRPA